MLYAGVEIRNERAEALAQARREHYDVGTARAVGTLGAIIEYLLPFLRVGASPRAAQAITLGAKVRALLDGRFHVSFQDIKEVAIPAMRHRVILNFEGEAEGITTDMVLEKVIAETPTTIEEELVTGRA